MSGTSEELTRNKVIIKQMINFDTNSNPKVSVIVPVYNVEKYLRECMDSIIGQTLEDIEIICVNDGSTDNSCSILKEYASKDKRVKIIDKENAGYGHVMNLGMDNAKGEYIGIVESDDYVEKDMYEKLYDVAVKNNADVVKSNFNRFIGPPEDRKFFFNKVGIKNSNYGVILDPSERLDVFNFIMNTWSGIYKREFLIKNNIRHNESPGASFQDNGFYFQTTAYTHRFMLVNEAFYNNRRDNESSSVMSDKKVNCMKEEYDYIEEVLKKDKKLYDKFMTTCLHKRFQNYFFTYERIADEYKLPYLKEISQEYKKYLEANQIDFKLYSNKEIECLKWIVSDPESFHNSLYGMSKKVSVIIPTYNESQHILECLQSIVEQKLQGVEIIIIDDGSQDDCINKADSFLKGKGADYSILSQQHQGSGAARNLGITKATAKYVAFMDADDLYPDRLVLYNLYIAAERNGAKVCGGSFSRLVDGRIITDFEESESGYVFNKAEFVNFDNYQFDYGYHRFIYLRELLVDNAIEFPKHLRYQDPPFLVNVMAAVGTFYSIPVVTYRYRKQKNKVIWNSEMVFGLLNGIDDVILLSIENGWSKLLYNSVMRINHDYLDKIMAQLDSINVDILIKLIQIQNHIDVELMNEYKPVKQPFVLKPLYRIMANSSKFNNSDEKKLLLKIDNNIEEMKGYMKSNVPFWKKITKKVG